MSHRAVALVLALAFAGCTGASNAVPSDSGAVPAAVARAPLGARPDVATNAVSNPGFESGALSPWTSCGSAGDAAISTAKPHSGTYGVLLGKTAKPEANGTAGICQTVTVPASATLTFWVYEGTNDTITYADQEADILSTGGAVLEQLYAEAGSTGGWVEKSFDLTAYAGQTVRLYFGVKGNGYASDYVYEYLDDVTLSSSSATASPSSAPTGSPTPAPTGEPTTAPTSGPTASPTAGPYACNDQQFLNDQSAFAAGTITSDQLVDICGSVTRVLPEKDTTSGHHGYFYVEMPSGYQIEIVSNLDAMAEASTDRPPSTWPWVAVNQYVYVQGRYYYDDAASQGVDWTEDDTSGSWEHVGYVAVCTSSGTACSKYW